MYCHSKSMRPMKPHRAGFTLVEILVATVALAIVGLIVGNMFTGTFTVATKTEKRADFRESVSDLELLLSEDASCSTLLQSAWPSGNWPSTLAGVTAQGALSANTATGAISAGTTTSQGYTINDFYIIYSKFECSSGILCLNIIPSRFISFH